MKLDVEINELYDFCDKLHIINEKKVHAVALFVTTVLIFRFVTVALKCLIKMVQRR